MYTQSVYTAGFLLATTAFCQDSTTYGGFDDPALTESAVTSVYSKLIDDVGTYLDSHAADAGATALDAFESTQTALPTEKLDNQDFQAYLDALAGQPIPTDAALLKNLPSTLLPFVTSVYNGVAAIASSDLSAQPRLSHILSAQASEVAKGEADVELVEDDSSDGVSRPTQATVARSGAGLITSAASTATASASGSGGMPYGSANGTTAATGGSISISGGSAASPTSSPPSSPAVSPKPSSGTVKLSLAFGGLGAVALAVLALL